MSQKANNLAQHSVQLESKWAVQTAHQKDDRSALRGWKTVVQMAAWGNQTVARTAAQKVAPTEVALELLLVDQMAVH